MPKCLYILLKDLQFGKVKGVNLRPAIITDFNSERCLRIYIRDEPLKKESKRKQFLVKENP